jgi:hypothetical protein
MLTAAIVTGAFLVAVIVGGTGCFFFVENTAFAPQTDPGGFAEQDDLEVPVKQA